MSGLPLTAALRTEYLKLWRTCEIRPSRGADVAAAVTTLLRMRDRYQAVQDLVGVPWFFVAVVHRLESGGRFDRHLHNGDLLSARTVHQPAGRPRTGEPPFTWGESAADALRLRKLDRWKDWSVAGLLYQLEGYNGFGYRLHHPKVLSPYLWSFSTHYQQGKYIADGTWSAKAVSEQCGAAVLLRGLEAQGAISVPEAPCAG